MSIQIIEIAYHRNGVGGEGFYYVLFKDNKADKGTFLATVFDGDGQVAVVNLDLIKERGVESGENSWRGSDDWEEELRQAIKEKEDAYDAKRFVENTETK
jgi:hypothetical protein